jgi:hypothetical protein
LLGTEHSDNYVYDAGSSRIYQEIMDRPWQIFENTVETHVDRLIHSDNRVDFNERPDGAEEIAN